MSIYVYIEGPQSRVRIKELVLFAISTTSFLTGQTHCRNKGESKRTGNKAETKVKANGYEQNKNKGESKWGLQGRNKGK